MSLTPQLPVDSDLEVNETSRGPLSPVHLHPRYLVIVAIGGAMGTALRELISLASPPVLGVSTATFAINVLGALLLGAFLESLSRRGVDEGRRRTVRLLLGTGALGGFTTYSALAVDSATLISTDHAGVGLAYAVTTVVIGAMATWTGIVAAAALHRARQGGAGK